RCQLLLAEVARRQADEREAARLLESAAVWVLHSGSVEHLCLLHLLRARFARTGTSRRLDVASRELIEGLRLAEHSGLRLYQIELLCEHAAFLLRDGDPAGAQRAEHSAREALRLASAADCQFLWGAGLAGHLAGEALRLQTRLREARRF